LSTIALGPPLIGNSVDDTDLDELAQSRLHLLLGNFDKALEVLQSLNGSDPAIAFEILRVFERRGHLKSALSVSFVPSEALKESASTVLFDLAQAYLECFAKGAWSKALRKAMDVCAQFLAAPLPQYPKFVLVYNSPL
jgi:hypothetical protein